MKNEHVTLRLSRDLAHALGRTAKELGIPKSQAARDALSRYLSLPGTEPEEEEDRLPARQLASKWQRLPRLTATEAADFSRDLGRARRTLPESAGPWV